MATASARKLRRQQSKEVWNTDLQKFFNSVRRGNVSDVDYYVRKVGIDVNTRDQWDNCPLYLACLCGHLEMVRYLLRAGAKYDSENVEGQRCFLSALTLKIREALREYQSGSTCQVSVRPPDQSAPSDLTIFLQTMYERTPDYDIELIVADQTFLGHKCILCVRSSYFYKRLTAPDMLQQDTLELTDPVFTPGGVRAILQFLYTGSLDLPIEDVEDTQSLAAFLGFTALANSIEEQVKQTISETSNEDLPEQVITVQNEKLKQDLISDLRKLVLSAVPLPLHNLVVDSQEHTEASKMEEAAMVTNTPLFPDVCFGVGDQQFECHKIFFYGRSEYFRIMLIEKQDDQPPTMAGYRPVIKLDDVTAEDFVQVLSFLYQDHCLAMGQQASLLDVCDRWTLTGLKLQLMNTGEGVTVSNVCQVYRASKHNEQLLDKCCQCMSENFMELASKHEFHQFLKRELPAPGSSRQEIKSPIIMKLLYQIRSTARTWHDKKYANEKIKKLNYIITNRLGYSANFTLFDVPLLPPSSTRPSTVTNPTTQPPTQDTFHDRKPESPSKDKSCVIS